jgi:hypothetical protein
MANRIITSLGLLLLGATLSRAEPARTYYPGVNAACIIDMAGTADGPTTATLRGWKANGTPLAPRTADVGNHGAYQLAVADLADGSAATVAIDSDKGVASTVTCPDFTAGTAYTIPPGVVLHSSVPVVDDPRWTSEIVTFSPTSSMLQTNSATDGITRTSLAPAETLEQRIGTRTAVTTSNPVYSYQRITTTDGGRTAIGVAPGVPTQELTFQKPNDITLINQGDKDVSCWGTIRAAGAAYDIKDERGSRYPGKNFIIPKNSTITTTTAKLFPGISSIDSLDINADGPIQGFSTYTLGAQTLTIPAHGWTQKGTALAAPRINNMSFSLLSNAEDKPTVATINYRDSRGTVVATQEYTLTPHETILMNVRDVMTDRPPVQMDVNANGRVSQTIVNSVFTDSGNPLLLSAYHAQVMDPVLADVKFQNEDAAMGLYVPRTGSNVTHLNVAAAQALRVSVLLNGNADIKAVSFDGQKDRRFQDFYASTTLASTDPNLANSKFYTGILKTRTGPTSTAFPGIAAAQTPITSTIGVTTTERQYALDKPLQLDNYQFVDVNAAHPEFPNYTKQVLNRTTQGQLNMVEYARMEAHIGEIGGKADDGSPLSADFVKHLTGYAAWTDGSTDNGELKNIWLGDTPTFSDVVFILEAAPPLGELRGVSTIPLTPEGRQAARDQYEFWKTGSSWYKRGATRLE